VSLARISAATGLSDTDAHSVRKGRVRAPLSTTGRPSTELGGVSCPFDDRGKPEALDVTWWAGGRPPQVGRPIDRGHWTLDGPSKGVISKVCRGSNRLAPKHCLALAALVSELPVRDQYQSD